MRATTIGAVLIGMCLTPRLSEAAVFTAWRLPFSQAQPHQVAPGLEGVHYVDFDGPNGTTFLGLLDVEKGRFKEMQIPFNAGSGDLRVRPGDGAVFVTDAVSGDLGQGNVAQQLFRRWTLPAGGYMRSFVFDEAGAVLFLAGNDVGRMSIGRLDTTTGAVTVWPLPDSMASPGDDFAWRIVRAADGTVFVNVNGFAHPAQLVRLDLTTGVFTAWVTPAAPIFPLVADDAGRIYFQEFGGDVRRIARFVPATGQLTEWNYPDAASEFSGEMALESGRLIFALNAEVDMAALDPTVAGDESVLAPSATEGVTPSTAVISPVVTGRARTRSGHARPVASTLPAIPLGAFTTWDTGGVGMAVGGGTGTGAVYGRGDVGGRPAIFRFVP
jgi:streptogramin lyase